MKQIVNVGGGLLCAISIISLVFGGAAFSGMLNVQNELNNRGQAEKLLDGLIGKDKENEERLKERQNTTTLFFVVGGVSGVLGIGLILAGRSKPNPV